MKQTVPNPLYKPNWQPRRQFPKLDWAVGEYRRRFGSPRLVMDHECRSGKFYRPEREAYLYRVWWEGMLQCWWKITFQRFLNYMKYGQLDDHNHDWGYWRNERYLKILRQSIGTFRDGRSYRRDVEHAPKRPDTRQLWRRVSGKERDLRRACGRRGPSRSFRRCNTRHHRAWVKQNLLHERWDAFHAREDVPFRRVYWD